MSNRRRVRQGIVSVFVLFSFLVVGTLAGIYISNYDHIGRMMKIISFIKSSYYKDVTATDLIDGAMQGMVESLGDKYSIYLNPKENEHLFEEIEGRFGGIGVMLSLKDSTRLIVLKPIKNSPAESAGILPGDEIVKIDDTDTASISQEEAIKRMRGKEGTQVALGIYRKSDERKFTAQITRQVINVPTVEWEIMPGTKDVAYIVISRFSSDTDKELDAVMKEVIAKSPKSMILDLRGNNGGELNAAVNVAGYFVPQGDVVYIVDKFNNSEALKPTKNNYLGIPLVVLIDGESASASEIVAGAIKDYKTATLVGSKTYGKGVVQTIYQLDGGSAVKLTTAKYLTPNKNDINSVGIEPDVSVEIGKGQVMVQPPEDPKQFDDQLKKALEVLSAK